MNHHRSIAIVSYALAGKGKALRLCHQLQQELVNRSVSCTVYSQQWPSHFESHMCSSSAATALSTIYQPVSKYIHSFINF